MRKIVKKQRAFIYYKARGYNNTDSVIKAGYKFKTREFAAKHGYNLLQKQDIVSAIDKEKLDIFDTSMITEEYILSGLREIAKNSKQDANKIRCYELLGKAKSLFVDRIDQEVTSDVTIQQIEQENTYLRQLYSNDN